MYFVLIGLLLNVAHTKTPDQEWLSQPASLTVADALNFYSLMLNAELASRVDRSAGLLDANIWLIDSDGKMRVDMLLKSTAVANLQAQTPGKQTAGLLEIHKGLTEALLDHDDPGEAKGGGLGIFGNINLPDSPFQDSVAKYLKSREAKDIVLSIGFRQDSASHLYATVFSDRVVFAPDAPPAK